MKKDSLTTEERFVNAGISLLKTHTVSQLSLRQIAREAGMTTGAFYKRFSNKKIYLSVLTKRISVEWARSLTPKLREIKDPLERLATLGDVLMQAMITQPTLTGFVLLSPVQPISTEKLKEWPLLNLTMVTIRAVVEKYGLPNEDFFFMQIWSFMMGYANLLANKSVVYEATLLRKTLRQLVQTADLK